jgi:HD-GYP domain-containing protein (c-di-GMP phosphodiesterase class II)
VTIAQHHERYNGSGYPRGLSGDDIHDHGQVAAIAEAYISLCSQEHDGQKARMPHEAYQMIVNAKGKLFHPDMVDTFVKTIAPYGPGTNVRLSDGKLGIVSKNVIDEPLYPVIRVTHDKDGLRFMPPFDLDLSKDKDLEIIESPKALPSDRVPA